MEMSQQNVERLRAGVELFLAGTSELDREEMLDKLAQRWDPEIEVDASESPVLDLNGVYRGADAVRQFWREWLAAWEALEFEYELVDAGDRVVQLFDMQMRGRSTHNKVVNFSGIAQAGEIVPVQITAATSQTLSGEMSPLARART